MTESDKLWLDERFNSLRESVQTSKEHCNEQITLLGNRVTIVEKKTETNSKFIWIATGAVAIISAILGVLEWNLRK